jgi:hypothetical protein
MLSPQRCGCTKVIEMRALVDFIVRQDPSFMFIDERQDDESP